jgi:hypothetical protein
MPNALTHVTLDFFYMGRILVVSRSEDILGGKFSVHEVQGISCQSQLKFSKLVQLQ